MADCAAADACSRAPAEDELGGGDGADGGGPGTDAGGGLTDTQREVLERCLHALKQAKNDSHTLAALLLITRLCPANQLDKPTLRRIFEAVGLSLPARLLVTAVRGNRNSELPPYELLSLGTALLSALSTDPDMASRPQLLATVPLLLEILENGDRGAAEEANAVKEAGGVEDTGAAEDASSPEDASPPSRLDEAVAADCYGVLTAVCALPRGPDQLLSRGAVPALCRAVERDRTLSRKRALPLLGRLLVGRTRDRAWSRHPAELLALLVGLVEDLCRAADHNRLDVCSRLVHFLPPAGVAAESEELKDLVGRVWGALRPLLQAKLTPRQIGPVLVLSASLLDLYGWGPVGPPKICCLLVNRACVEVRMALEEPPGADLSPPLKDTLTGCYRILEAAIEQACGPGAPPEMASPSRSAVPGLSLQQSRQVLGVLEEAFSAIIYYLQQVDPGRYGDPFIFATFRCLCSWLAEETSCLKEEVTGLLPFLVGYARSHLRGGDSERALSDWMAEMSVTGERGAWTGSEALRYLLPALCHLSAEDGPRKALLAVDTPALLVDFLSQSWAALNGRDPGMETACSALLNVAVTEPERVRADRSFRTLEKLLGEALPVLVHKDGLLVLAANFCTLGLMIGRLRAAPTGSVEAGRRRFFSSALLFLRGALDSELSPGAGKPGGGGDDDGKDDWAEASELWRLGLQALGGCIAAQPWVATLLRDEGWLGHALARLGRGGAAPDPSTRDALEEALCAAAAGCALCGQDIRDAAASGEKNALNGMKKLKQVVGVK